MPAAVEVVAAGVVVAVFAACDRYRLRGRRVGHGHNGWRSAEGKPEHRVKLGAVRGDPGLPVQLVEEPNAHQSHKLMQAVETLPGLRVGRLEGRPRPRDSWQDRRPRRPG